MERRLYAADIAQELGVSRPTAAKYMDTMRCVYLPTAKNARRYVLESVFREWERMNMRVRADEQPPQKKKRKTAEKRFVWIPGVSKL